MAPNSRIIPHWYTGGLLVLLMFASSLILTYLNQRVAAWMVALLLMSLFLCWAGQGVTGSWRGIFIDPRNVISLSRFQMAIWTLIILSAFLTAAFFNISVGSEDSLSIQVPSQLWTILGISTASLVGAPLILNQKATDQPSEEALQKTKVELQKQGFQNTDTSYVGKILVNTQPDVARWSDMFTGDETSNGAHLDLGKVQMFLFTVLIAASYMVALFQLFRYAQSDGITSLPALDQSTVSLLGISHAGYLINKGIPRQ